MYKKLVSIIFLTVLFNTTHTSDVSKNSLDGSQPTTQEADLSIDLNTNNDENDQFPDFLVSMLLVPQDYSSFLLAKAIEENTSILFQVDDKNCTLLDYALLGKNYTATKELLKYNRYLLDDTEKILFAFNQSTQLDILRLSIDNKTGKAFDQKRKDRLLYVATSRGELANVKILLDSGANPIAKSFHNTSPMDIAQKHDFKPFIHIFNKNLKYLQEEDSEQEENDVEEE